MGVGRHRLWPVYQSLLTRRYLTSQIMPLLASLAVMLCTAMVLIVWSVMGGFLATFVNQGRVLVGDVIVAWPNIGFAYYDDLAARLEKDPEVAATAPIIEAFGLVGLPDGRQETVRLIGIDGARYAKVTSYGDSIYWRVLQKPLPKDVAGADWRTKKEDHDIYQRMYDNALAMKTDRLVNELQAARDPARRAAARPGAVLGIMMSGFNSRDPAGFFMPRARVKLLPDGTKEWVETILPIEDSVTVNVLPLDRKGRPTDMVSRAFPVINEFHTGLYEVDNKTVLLELGALQQMLKMDAARRIKTDATGAAGRVGGVSKTAEGEKFVLPETVGEDPARITTLLVRGKGDAATARLEDLRARVERIYAQFAADHKGEVPDASSIRILTWEDQNATLITAVKKETALVLSLFSFISLTAVFLVLAIFWSMVSEKTREIGILRSLGASRAGITWLWVRYGLAIGVIGAALGLSMSYLIVSNINPIHEWMGARMGIQIWDPRIYYFTVIPTDLSVMKVLIVCTGGVLSSAAGALWPALRAARMDPVKALRFE